MLMLSRSRRMWGLGWMLLIPVVALGPGCSSRPENSPVVRKKFQELAGLQEQMADMAVQMKQVGAEMAAMRKDVSDVRALNGGGEAVAKIEQIDTRMLAMEQEMAKLTEAINANAKSRQVASALPSEPEESEPASTKGAEKPASSSSTSSSSASRSSGSSESGKSRTVSASSSALPVRKVSQVTTPKPRGKYYTIKSGDTAASIAKSNGIDIDTLLRANRLPKEATIFPGQRLYVPAGN